MNQFHTLRAWLVLPLFLLLILSDLFAQNQVIIQRNYRPGTSSRTKMEAQYYPFNSTVLDLTKFREKYPEYKNFVPREYTIKPPDLTGMTDVVYSVIYLEDPNGGEGLLLIYLVGNYFSDSPVHFFDYNLDHNYQNDKETGFIFPKGAEIQTFTFYKTGTNFQQFQIEILNPEFQVATDQEELMERIRQSGLYQKDNEGVIYQLPEVDYSQIGGQEASLNIPRKKQLLTARFKAMIGFGSIGYSYEQPVTNYPGSYRADFNAKGVGTDLFLNIKNFRVGVNAGIENIFYWSSRENVQTQEPYTICEENRWRRLVCTDYDGFSEYINRDIKPKNRVTYGMIAEYAFLISRKTRLTPYGQVGFFQYLNDVHIPNRAYRDVNYSFGRVFTWEGGIRLEHTVSNNGDIVISTGFQNMSFEPQGFFDNYVNVKNSHFQGNVSLGYQFGLL